MEEKEEEGDESDESGLSKTLFWRKNVFREMGFLRDDSEERVGGVVGLGNRWSDCGCESCVSWLKNGGGDQKLHLVVMEPSEATEAIGNLSEDVIFLHGFISSSSFWSETVFPNLSDSAKQRHRLFAVDLLGFGRSPKPTDCLYTMRDHLEMIEKSVIHPYRLNSFHLVGYSMGCNIALALSAKYTKSVKTLTLIAPPYVSSPKGHASLISLNKFAKRALWPPLLFGSSVMSWYEHLGRCLCFLLCRNHRTWEFILKLLSGRRDLHFLVMDLPRHTHHSAWHTFHNVICGGADLMDKYLDVMKDTGVKITVIHGDRDTTVPSECINNLKMKVQNMQINIIPEANHISIVLGRAKDLTWDLEHIWAFVETHEG